MSGTTGGARTVSLNPASGGLSFPRLAFALLRQRFTGTVALQQLEPAGERTVWFRGGMPVFTDWVSQRDRLGQILIEAGALDADGLERALVHQSSGGLLGEILVALQLIEPATRSEALRDQCMRKLVCAFAPALAEGSAAVTVVDHDRGKNDGLVQVNVLTLIRRGVWAHYERARIEAEMGEALSQDLVATPAMVRYERQFGFPEGARAVLTSLGRGTTMSGMLRPGMDIEEALRVIYTLWACQMLRVGQDAVEAIAKGATAAAVSSQPRPKPTSQPKPKPKPKPEPKPSEPEAKPPEAKPPEAQPPEYSSDEREFVADLEALEAKVEAEANAFELFALERDAGRKQVRSAWATLSKRFHPDGLEGAGRAHLRGRVEKVFAALSEAYGILSNKQEREKLASALEAGVSAKPGEDPTAVVRNAFEAEMLARDADKQLRAKQYGRAAELFERAHELSPKDSDVEAALIFSRFRAGPRHASDAHATVSQLDKLLADASNCARAHYFKGLVSLELDDEASAKASFAAALELDKRNIDAERQLRAIRMRERATRAEAKKKEERGFGLRSLFKKD